ncbi:MAG: hypothetical protein BWY15_00093 [Firmicutes bacterium ADurb.Bin193]|nr:MAG: hypothetical protein BWY15_00093 [Firmicutes bacterium ADurb.Bin193]
MLPDIGGINVSTRVKNISNETQNVRMIVALYDSKNILINSKCVEKNIDSNNTEDFFDSIVIDGSVRSMKVFLLKGNMLQPIITSVSKSKP